MKSILTKAGFKKNKQGFYALKGKVVKFSMEDPISYSDYYADIQLMSSELKSEGIDATVDGVEASQWYTDSADGHFDSIEHWGNGGTDPYTQFDNWFDYKNSAAIGKTADADFGRYHNASGAVVAGEVGSNRPAEHGGRKGRDVATREDRGDDVARHAAVVWRGLGRVQHGELHRIRDCGQPVRGPVAERP